MKRLLAHVLVALIVIAALAGTLGYRKAYGTWWGRRNASTIAVAPICTATRG